MPFWWPELTEEFAGLSEELLLAPAVLFLLMVAMVGGVGYGTGPGVSARVREGVVGVPPEGMYVCMCVCMSVLREQMDMEDEKGGTRGDIGSPTKSKAQKSIADEVPVGGMQLGERGYREEESRIRMKRCAKVG